MALETSRGVRNRIGWRQRLHRLQGGAVRFDLQRFDAPLAEINGCEHAVRRLSDAEVSHRAGELRRRARAGAPPGELRVTTCALVREASRRVLGVRPFDVQVVAALALESGAVVEMQTGEGKTLAGVMAAALYALDAPGIHILTANDYLASRDARWMEPVYRMLGLSVGHVEQEMDADGRRAAYLADVTCVTAREAGFDHLRDLMAAEPAALVHRRFHVAIVDEADSLMIDEARVPLVIAGTIEEQASPAEPLAALVAALEPGRHYDTDEHGQSVELTEAGIDHVERVLACGTLHTEGNHALLTALNCALHAHVLLRREVDYLVRDGRIEMVDELTGRIARGRRWPDGLQRALEAKEGLRPRDESRTLTSMTLRRFLRGYPRLCGMTGTGQDCAPELRELYGLEVVVMPPNRPVIRIDRPDLVFRTRDAKEHAVVDEVRRVNRTGRPVLVGTVSIGESERLAARLAACGVSCQILNARHDAAEAGVVAGAGALGAVTIATNMAGRGTDIRLGGADEQGRLQVAALGGLYVLGTNRHESRRVDLQLRGRAGRQGDPGESRFFVSLEDDLLVRHGIHDLIPARHVPETAGEPIDNPIVRREIARAQRIADGCNREIRRALLRYSAIVEEQHRILLERRQALLFGKGAPDIWRRTPDRFNALRAAIGEPALRTAERAATLHHIDRAWSDHLNHCAELRESSPLVRLGGQEPLQRFAHEAIIAFSGIHARIDDAVLNALRDARIVDGRIDLAALGLRAPASTWTHLVNDDPFRNQIGALLAGAGGTTVAIYSAAVLMPLLLLWGVVERFFGRRPGRRSSPFGPPP